MINIISVNVGLPREVIWKGKSFTTGIFKEPVIGQVMLRTLNLDGDRQADLSVHGGRDKAVYAYPSEHYDYWRQELPERELPWGMFGENLTIAGLLEEQVNIGDRFRIGSAEVIVTQPRSPCYKLGIRFGNSDMVKRFENSHRSGFYLAVLKEGEIGVNNNLELLSRDKNQITVAEINRLYLDSSVDVDLLKRAVQVQSLAAGWRSYFQKKLDRLN